MSTPEPGPAMSIRDSAADDALVTAQTAAEAVRELNHATITGDGYDWPSDVDAVVAELHLIAARMEQALDQGRRWLDRAHVARAVGHDQGADIEVAISDADLHFRTAASDARRLAEDLESLRDITAHLTGIRTGPELGL